MIVSYMLPACSVGGGPKTVYHHLNRLHELGHDVRLFAVRGWDGAWFSHRYPVVICESYQEASERMAELDGIKIATWWETAPWVILACERRGVPVYLVQDIETSYYKYDPRAYPFVLDTYMLPWRQIVTISPWTEDRLRELGVTCPIEVIPPPIDLETFRPGEVPRDSNRLLVVGRSHYLKGYALMLEALQLLANLQLPLKVMAFGIEPGMQIPMLEGYRRGLTDVEVAELYSGAFAYLSTSEHEGFNVPILEAMACGTPVITTLADGNDHFCRDGHNCLIVSRDPADVANAIFDLWSFPEAQATLRRGGLETAGEYSIERRCGQIEKLYEGLLA